MNPKEEKMFRHIQIIWICLCQLWQQLREKQVCYKNYNGFFFALACEYCFQHVFVWNMNCCARWRQRGQVKSSQEFLSYNMLLVKYVWYSNKHQSHQTKQMSGFFFGYRPQLSQIKLHPRWDGAAALPPRIVTVYLWFPLWKKHDTPQRPDKFSLVGPLFRGRTLDWTSN